MTLSPVIRRGLLATAAVGSAVAMTACSAGQISQTSDQVAAVDGARNDKTGGIVEGVAIRDSQIVFDDAQPGADAALKFTAVNQDRSGVEFTLNSVKVDGVGEVALERIAATPTFERAVTGGEKTLPRDCSMVVDSRKSVETMAANAKDNPGCIAYYASSFNGATISGVTDKGEHVNAAAQNRTVTYSFTSSDGRPVEYTLLSTVSPFIPMAGETNRGDDGAADVVPEASAPIADTVEGAKDALKGVPGEKKGLSTGYSLEH